MMEGSGRNAPIVGITTMFTRDAGDAGDAPLHRRRATFAAFRGTTPMIVLMGQRWAALEIAAALLAEVARILEVQVGLLPPPGHPPGGVVVDSRWISLW